MRMYAIWLLCVLCIAIAGAVDGPTVLLAAVGDVMVGRRTPEMVRKHGAPWVWSEIAPIMEQADIRFCNLECALTNSTEAIKKPFVFRVAPSVGQQVLRAGGFNVVSLANNHAYDYGPVGLASTLTAVEDAGILAAGAGRGRAQAIAPRIITVNGLRVGLVAYTWWIPEMYEWGATKPSLAILNIATLPEEIRQAKSACDVLVVSMHWGNEYTQTIPEIQRYVAHLAVENGADLILGHHAHVAQEIEWYHDRPIFHSLGNCLFDRNTHPSTPGGLLALIRLTPDKVQIERTVPLQIHDVRPVPFAQ